MVFTILFLINSVFVNIIKQSLVNNKLITRTRRSVKCQKTGVIIAEIILTQMEMVNVPFVEMISNYDSFKFFILLITCDQLTFSSLAWAIPGCVFSSEVILLPRPEISESFCETLTSKKLIDANTS